MNDSVPELFINLRQKVQELEEAEYRTQTRIHLVPPHIVLINAENQKQYDQLLHRHRRDNVLQNDFLTFPNGTQAYSNLLEEVNEQVFQKKWDRLSLEYQINRLFVFLNEFQTNNSSRSIEPEVMVRLRRQLVDATFRKELTGNQVTYDCQRGFIREIRGLANDGSLTIDKATSDPCVRRVDTIVTVHGDQYTTEPFTLPIASPTASPNAPPIAPKKKAPIVKLKKV